LRKLANSCQSSLRKLDQILGALGSWLLAKTNTRAHLLPLEADFLLAGPNFCRGSETLSLSLKLQTQLAVRLTNPDANGSRLWAPLRLPGDESLGVLSTHAPTGQRLASAAPRPRAQTSQMTAKGQRMMYGNLAYGFRLLASQLAC